MELKPRITPIPMQAIDVLLSNHCGIETLVISNGLSEESSYYRTIVELKHLSDSVYYKRYEVIIEPLWN